MENFISLGSYGTRWAFLFKLLGFATGWANKIKLIEKMIL